MRDQNTKFPLTWVIVSKVWISMESKSTCNFGIFLVMKDLVAWQESTIRFVYIFHISTRGTRNFAHFESSNALHTNFVHAPSHIVWKLLKMSQLSFWHFWSLKSDLSGNTVWPWASKSRHNWPFLVFTMNFCPFKKET